MLVESVKIEMSSEKLESLMATGRQTMVGKRLVDFCAHLTVAFEPRNHFPPLLNYIPVK